MMEFDDDGYGQFGGNGSVEWTIDVKNPKFACSTEVRPEGLRQNGADANGRAGDNFTLSLELPATMNSLDEFRKYLMTPKNWEVEGRDRLAIKLQIESRNPDQVRISWPKARVPRKGGA